MQKKKLAQPKAQLIRSKLHMKTALEDLFVGQDNPNNEASRSH